MCTRTQAPLAYGYLWTRSDFVNSTFSVFFCLFYSRDDDFLKCEKASSNILAFVL